MPLGSEPSACDNGFLAERFERVDLPSSDLSKARRPRKGLHLEERLEGTDLC